MIEICDWSRVHRSQLERWPEENNPLLPALMLRSSVEPYYAVPKSLAVLVGDNLIGRFTYRIDWDGYAFIGIALSPAFRGRGYGFGALARSLLYLADLGISRVYASIAWANIASRRIFQRAGFVVSVYEWRYLPASYDVSLLAALPDNSYVLAPVPALMFCFVSRTLDASIYAEVAQ